MAKFSVKKPLTVFVAVIVVIVLGVVSYLKMTPDLIPNMDFPYVMIMTTYPGASPEKVEETVTKPLEQSMSTLEHIKEVSSTSAENYSMVMLEFEESVNLDTIGVDIQQSITSLSANWDDMVGTPYVLKINPSMLPVAVAGVSMEGMDTVQLTEFLNEKLMNKMEGIAGVARISTSGAITQQLHIILDQQKIDALNESIADKINEQLDAATKELDEKKQELTDAQEQIENAKDQLDGGKDALVEQITQGEAQISGQQQQLMITRSELQAQLGQLQSAKMQLESMLQILTVLEDGMTQLQQQADGFRQDIEILLGLSQRKEELEALRAELEAKIEEIRNNAEMSQEQIDAAIQQIKNSEEYIAMEAQWAALKAQLAAYGLDIEGLEAGIAERQAALESILARLEELEKTLADEGMDAESLSSQIDEMQNNLLQIDEGIAALEDALDQLDSGMLQLQDAANLLNQQKTSGLLELSSAATELAVNSGTLTAAMSQIEAGYTTIDTSRQDALDKADLNEILTMEMITNILTAQNFSMPAGYVEQDGINYMVSVGDEITKVEDLESLLLFDMGMKGVEPIYLADVAAVMLTDNRDESYTKLNGMDGIVLSFEKQSTYATAEVTNNIADRFEELEEEHDGLKFVTLMDQGDYIYLIVETILKSLGLGALFSVLILFVFLRDIRPTFITLCSIPLSVVFAIVLMYFSGVTINMISLSGLAVAVGMLVDNSVVVIENIYRLRAKGANAVQAAVSGAGQVAGAVIASTLTTVCVFLPIVFVEGITRQLFTDLALTMSYALLASLVVSLTLVPTMASTMLRKEKEKKSGFMDKVLAAYRKAAAWALDHKLIVLATSLVLLIATGLASVSRGFSFMPEMDMSSVTVSVSMPEDIAREDAVSMADEVLTKIEKLDGIATVGAMMSGGDASSLLSAGGSSYDVTIYITLEDENASGAAVAKQIEEMCADMECTVSGSSAMMDMSMLTGSGVSMRLYADDMDALQQAAIKAGQVLEKIPGVVSVSNGLEEAVPAYHVVINRNAAMKKGITVAQIYMELASELTTQTTAASMKLDGTTTDVIIEKPEDSHMSIDDLEHYVFEVTGMDGSVVTFGLREVAVIRETTSLASINRLSQRRYLSLSAELEAGENVTLVTAQAERAMAKADLGQGVSYVFTGENETIMEAIEQLLLMLLLGVLLVYLVMVAQFQSFKSPFIVMFTIPLAFTGGFLALIIGGMEVSVIALIGFIMLTGIIVNNGIVLVDYINQRRLEGAERREAILDAGVTRMRPILMTSITTILGLLDMAINKTAGTTLMQPMAVVCIGGLAYATLMTLFVVPCIYDMLNKKELRKVSEEDLKLLDI